MLEHDYYSLWKSFNDVLQILKASKKLDQSSRYNDLVEDLKNFKIPLDIKIDKWTKIFKNDELLVWNIYE